MCLCDFRYFGVFCGISVLSGIYLDRVSLLLLFYPSVPVASESNDGVPFQKGGDGLAVCKTCLFNNCIFADISIFTADI